MALAIESQRSVRSRLLMRVARVLSLVRVEVVNATDATRLRLQIKEANERIEVLRSSSWKSDELGVLGKKLCKRRRLLRTGGIVGGKFWPRSRLAVGCADTRRPSRASSQSRLRSMRKHRGKWKS